MATRAPCPNSWHEPNDYAAHRLAVVQQVIEIMLSQRPTVRAITRLEGQGKRKRTPMRIVQPFVEVDPRRAAG